MKWAIVRLGMISLITIIMLFGIVFTLRQVGFSMAGKTVAHPLFEQNFWAVIRPPEERMSQSHFDKWISTELSETGAAAHEDNNKNHNKIVPWIDLRRSFDGHWFLSPLEWIETENQKKAVHLLAFDEIRAHWPDQQPVQLEHIAALAKQRAVWLNIIEKDKRWAKDLENELKDVPAGHIMLHSPVRMVGRELRKDRPEWLFASDGATVNRFLLMKGLFIETIEDFWPDIFFSPLFFQGQEVFTPRMQAELKRRSLPVVIDVSGGADLSSFSGFPIKGLVARSTAELSAAKESLNQ